MDQSAFNQAVIFAFADVRREIALAKTSQTPTGQQALAALNIQQGGGNFLAALGLLCYTEFGGKLKYNQPTASGNFNRFFDEMGTDYARFRAAGNNVYDIFRCGLAHEFFVKRPCEILIVAPPGGVGVGKLLDGRYYIAVEQYCNDLERAFGSLEAHLVATRAFGSPPAGGITSSGYIAGS
jgi:hypothetical protein